MLEFNAKCVKYEKDKSGSWVSSETIIKSIQDILNIFKPHEDTVQQVDIDMFHKVYYSTDFISESGVDGFLIDADGTRRMLVSPLLFVECDEEKPINISSDSLKKITDSIDFC
jgi:hypothetical protein